MPYFRKKAVVVEAHQWWRNGDHPADYDAPDFVDPISGRVITTERRRTQRWEGDVVRYFRRPEPEYRGDASHEPCGYTWDDHGWIDTLEGGHTVCPGDWIITGIQGERYPCKLDIFDATYEPVEEAS